jgi:transposase-like protein
MSATALVERRRNQSRPPQPDRPAAARHPAPAARPAPLTLRATMARFEGPAAGQAGKLEILGGEGASSGFTRYVRSPAQDTAIAAELARGKSRRLPAPHAILLRHWKGRNSPEEAMLELYHAAISVGAADDVARLLWGERAGVALVGECRQEITRQIQTWLQRKIAEPQVYVFFQTITLKQKVDGESRVTNLVAAVGVNRAGLREGLAVAEGDPAGDIWDRLLVGLKQRGLRETGLFVGANDPAAHAAVARHFPAARYQGCLEQLEREVLGRAPVSQVHSIMSVFEGLGEPVDEASARQRLATLAVRLRQDRLVEASALIEQCAAFQFSYLQFPVRHWGRLRDTEPLKSVLRDFREHIRLIGPLVDPAVLVLMVAARMRYAAQHFWSQRRYINF